MLMGHDRIGYTICWAQYKMKTWDPLLEIIKNIQIAIAEH